VTTAAILLAGGSGSRMGRADNKVFADLLGRPLLVWSVDTFVRSTVIDHVVLVTRAGERRRVRDVLVDHGVDRGVHLTIGGATRQASEQAGLSALADLDAPSIDIVLIHDTARPFATAALVERVTATARAVGGAVPALALGPGIHRSTDDGRLVAQPDDLYRVQTPQGLRARPLLDAYGRAARDGFASVDTVATVQRYTSVAIAAVPGEPDNIKVTFAGDLDAARVIAARRGARRR
jgi:2-C-methyl-D-erythritol 4-phosphate cytidylyltransferase